MISVSLAALVIGLGAFGVLNGGNDIDRASAPERTSGAPTAVAPTSASSGPAVNETARGKMTTSQEQAVRKAEQYLDYSAFSKKGLIKQLKYEGFSAEDATFAVENIQVDWNEQAATKAEQYLDNGAFSRKGLIRQLEYEGFTQEQAEYGANAVGL